MNYIFWTCRNDQEANTIIRQLLEKSLIACASIIPDVKSLYRWKGKIEESLEVKVILKTEKKHFDAICSYITSHSSYEVPEIVEIDVSSAYAPYAAWVKEEVANDV
jgi:periplasmic divalent cation tolerance protein